MSQRTVIDACKPKRTVHVTAVQHDDCIVMTPLDDASESIFAEILSGSESLREWTFRGSQYRDRYTKDLLVGVNYACGGQAVTIVDGNLTTHTHDGDINLYIDLDCVADLGVRFNLMIMGYAGSGIAVRADSTAERMVLVGRATCKVCHKVLVPQESGYKVTCSDCKAVCEHEFGEGLGESRGSIAVVSKCQKCGTHDPSWKPSENPYDDFLAVLDKGYVHTLAVQGSEGQLAIIRKAGKT